jgi:ribonuclease D
MDGLSKDTGIPLENLLTPEYLRRVCWEPPRPVTKETLSRDLANRGARAWQQEAVVPLLLDAFVALDQ